MLNAMAIELSQHLRKKKIIFAPGFDLDMENN